MPYVRWAGRPAVLMERSTAAFAVLKPGGGWTRVDTEQVCQFGEVITEQVWRAEFEPAFGVLNVRNIPREPYPSHMALAMARAQQGVAAQYDDEELRARGDLLEERALHAIRAGKDFLDPLN